MTNARSLVLWLYNDASAGDISDVYELEDQYVVAAMTGMQEEGLARLEDVKNEVTLKVRNSKKAEIIKKKLSGSENKTFGEIADAYGEGATTGDATMTLSSNSIGGVGIAPRAVGLAFSMEEGETTSPFESVNGVLIMKVTAKNEAQAQEDYTTYAQQLTNQRTSRKMVVTDFPLTYFRVMVSQDLNNAIKELSGLEDRRYKFF